MKKYLWLCLFAWGLISNAHACINENYTEIDWHTLKSKPFGPNLLIDTFSSSELYSHLQALEEKPGSDTSLDIQNDMAVVYMRLGDPGTAKQMLLRLEGNHPGTYSVAANLGTCYELLGEIDSALIWIHKAITISPKAHENSEWIHVMILRYEKTKSKNPQYLAGGSALMLDFGNKDIPENSYDLQVKELLLQLGYQLEERLQFVYAPDTLMGMLLFDYANLCALNNDLKAALVYFEKAREFGFQSDVLEAREARIQEMLEKNPEAGLNGQEGKVVEAEEGSGTMIYLIAIGIALLSVGGVWLLLRKGRNR
ncbi:MAG: hypothetical protein GC180_12465 [Bacteroidetes bacterium]|nr:hypothetical protein [Bacteroidota bacterium]